MDYIKEILRGILIGVANIIPGVSGGTLAVSMGIYDKIIYAVTHIFKDTKRSIVTLLPYGIGAGIGVVGLSFAIEYLFLEFPLQTSLTFIGLITGGIPALTGKMKHRSIPVRGYVLFLVTFLLVTAMALFSGYGGNASDVESGTFSVVSFFGIGMVAASTMVIPGVSGTMILMILGYYQPVISAVNQFITSVFTADFQQAWVECALLVPFGLGVLAGIFACAKLIEILFRRFELMTYCAIMGLVISSPIVILAGISYAGVGLSEVLAGAVCFIISYAGAVQLSKGSDTKAERLL